MPSVRYKMLRLLDGAPKEGPASRMLERYRSMGAEAGTPGNLWIVEPVSARDFQRIKDSARLTEDLEKWVHERLAETMCPEADVTVMSIEKPFDIWHLPIERGGYRVARMAHTVREA